jgi:tRNA threonylcarbamoyl adenosine modification protein YeaZ
MKTLALEFSSDRRSVAVLHDGKVLGAADETGGRSTRAFGMIARALDQAGLKREEIECLVVGIGPGSYTGIRAGIAVAQGWQLAGTDRRVKLLGVSSAACLAAEAQISGHRGRLHVVIDAQRGELYHSVHELDERGCREVSPLRLATPDQIRASLISGDLVAGPDCQRWFPQGIILHPSAGMLGRIAAGRTDFVSGEALEPIYLRETSFVKAAPPRILPES